MNNNSETEEMRNEHANLRSRIQRIQNVINLDDGAMGEFFGVSDSTYNRYKSGVIKVPIDRFILFVKQTGVDANYLIYGEPADKVFIKESIIQHNDFEMNLMNLRIQIEKDKRKMTDTDRFRYASILFQIGYELTN